MSIQNLAADVVARDHRAIARAISLIENESSDAAELIGHLFGHAGRASLIGVTGPPGVGKSTLVDCLTRTWRSRDRTVGIVAIDPTSPFSGGALLGDRIRMQSHTDDEGVYVRSMATRGHVGGVASATSDAVVVLDAAGMDIVIVETVGVGQGQIDIALTADVSIVVTVPGTGDDVQAIKAGIMEIADVFVVNKADATGADRAVAEIESALSLREYAPGTWRPPVLKTEATSCGGVTELVDAVERFGARHPRDGQRRQDRARVRLRETLLRRLAERLDSDDNARAALEEAAGQVSRGEVDPYTAITQILERLT